METRRDAIPSPIMTTPEVAQYLRVHQGTLYKLIRRGQIPAFKIGTDYRFNRDAIEKLITDREDKGRPGSVATLKTVTEDVPSGAGRRSLRQPDRTAGR